MIPEEIELPDRIAGAELIADRRGSRIWKVRLAGDGIVAVKYTIDDARGTAAREAAVLRHIDREGYLYAAGETESGSWAAFRWVTAPTIGQRWRGWRTTGDPRARMPALVSTWRAAGKLAQLHQDGWRHGDLQADHILVPDHGPAQLIDFALAQGPVPIEPRVIYRGALAHLTAPEVAAELLSTSAEHHVTLSRQAEVYSFGAVLFAVWTGQWRFDYEAEPRTVALPDIYARICEPRWRRPLPGGWPRMASLINSALEPDPAKRPTFAEVAAELSRPLP